MHHGEAAVAKKPAITTSAATRKAPPATATAAETSSALRAASTSSLAPSTALATRLGPPPQPPFNEVTVTGRHRRSGDNAFYRVVSRAWRATQDPSSPRRRRQRWCTAPTPYWWRYSKSASCRSTGRGDSCGRIVGSTEEGGDHCGTGDEPADRPRQLCIGGVLAYPAPGQT